MDPTWDAAGTVSWSVIEVNMGIICSCLVTLRPLATKLFPKVFQWNPRPQASLNLQSPSLEFAEALSSSSGSSQGKSRGYITNERAVGER
jgi:hypothetical protein